jgi:hypothetical protein
MEVAEDFGHVNVTLVRQVYGHSMPDPERRTRKAIDPAWVTGGSHGNAVSL